MAKNIITLSEADALRQIVHVAVLDAAPIASLRSTR